MSLQIRELQPEDAASWDEFVAAHPYGTPFHLTHWGKSLEQVFGYRSLSLVAFDGHSVSGVLPLFHVKNPIIGSVLISSPFAVYGGILANSPEASQALLERASALGRSLGVDHVEFRNAREQQCSGLPRIDRYVTFTQSISEGTGEDLLAALPKKTRNMIRKALRFPYTSRTAASLDAFHRLIALSYRRLGTPCFAPAWFEALCRNFGPLACVREIVLDGRVLAVSLSFLFRGEMHTYYAASDQDYLDKAPNNFLYYDHLLWAASNGCHTFDFGRSKKETGTFEFKKHWLTEMRELPYEVLLVKRKSLPDFSPKNPKFHAAIRVWQKLPLPLTRFVGPHVVRLFP